MRFELGQHEVGFDSLALDSNHGYLTSAKQAHFGERLLKFLKKLIFQNMNDFALFSISLS